MSANSPKSGLTYPSLADPPNAPSNLQTLASQLDGIVIPKYASSTARDAANPTPASGDMCYRTDLKAYQSYDGSAWSQIGISGWQSWTPTWSTSTAAHVPGYGNAVVSCVFQKHFRTCHFTITITMGSTTNFNSGGGGDNWTFSPPPGCTPSSNFSNQQGVFPCVMARDSFNRFMGHASFLSATQLWIVVDSASVGATAPTNSGGVDAVTPFTWQSGDILQISGTYETTT